MTEYGTMLVIYALLALAPAVAATVAFSWSGSSHFAGMIAVGGVAGAAILAGSAPHSSDSGPLIGLLAGLFMGVLAGLIAMLALVLVVTLKGRPPYS